MIDGNSNAPSVVESKPKETFFQLVFQIELFSNFSYKTKYRLTQHLKTHKPSQCLPCSVCNKEFSTQIKLNTHMKIHEEVGTYSCTFCDKTFHYSGQLQVNEGTNRFFLNFEVF